MRPAEVSGHRGIISTGHSLATQDACAVLRDGGNAFDATIAAAATLSVVAPHECGLGGDLFAVIFDARTRKVSVLNGTGCSPAAATAARYADGIPETGPLSISLPGMVAAWAELHERYASRPLSALFAPALGHAERGFAITEVMHKNIVERLPSVSADTGSSSIFLDGSGAALPAGTVVRQPATAQTLRAIANKGADGFYKGEVAAALAEELRLRGGILSVEDLADCAALWQEPLATRFCDVDVYAPPPNAWGAGLLLQLRMLADETIPDDDAGLFILGIRAREAAYRALSGAIADPDIAGDRARRLLGGEAGQADGHAQDRLMPIASSDTSQVVVADAAGNVVVMLQSVSIPFGSGIYLRDTGVLMNNRLSGFNTKAGDANCVAPRKRPANTLVPSMVVRDGEPVIGVATPGGPGQTGTLAQFLARLLSRGESLVDATAAPRWSITRYGDWLLEATCPKDIVDKVRAAYPDVKIVPWGAVNAGSVAAIVRDGGRWTGITDTRRDASIMAV